MSPDFVNVDLEVETRRSIDPLVEALSPSTVLLARFRRGPRYVARFELGVEPQNPDQGIRVFGRLVRRLPVRARKLWNAAIRRDFDVGIRASVQRGGGDLALSRATVEEVARLRSRIVITIYRSNGRGAA